MKLAAERSLSGMNPFGGMVQASRPLSAVGTRMNGFAPAPPTASVPTSPPSSFRNYSQYSASTSSPGSTMTLSTTNSKNMGILEVEDVHDELDQHQPSTPKKTDILFSNQFDTVNSKTSPQNQTTSRQRNPEPTGVNNFFDNNALPQSNNQTSSGVGSEQQVTKNIDITDIKSFFIKFCNFVNLS